MQVQLAEYSNNHMKHKHEVYNNAHHAAGTPQNIYTELQKSMTDSGVGRRLRKTKVCQLLAANTFS